MSGNDATAIIVAACTGYAFRAVAKHLVISDTKDIKNNIQCLRLIRKFPCL